MTRAEGESGKTDSYKDKVGSMKKWKLSLKDRSVNDHEMYRFPRSRSRIWSQWEMNDCFTKKSDCLDW